MIVGGSWILYKLDSDDSVSLLFSVNASEEGEKNMGVLSLNLGNGNCKTAKSINLSYMGMGVHSKDITVDHRGVGTESSSR